MKYLRALKIAIEAMKLQRRKHATNYNAYLDGFEGNKGEHDKYVNYTKAIEKLEEVINYDIVRLE